MSTPVFDPSGTTRRDFLALASAGGISLCWPALAGSTVRSSPDEVQVFIGTFTYQTSEGIYGFRLNTRTGQLTPTPTTPYRASPNFLGVHPNQRYLYATDEVLSEGGRNKSFGVVAFAIDPLTHALTQINRHEVPRGAYHLSVHPSGKWILVACYGAGRVVLLPIMPDGSLGPVRDWVQHTGHGPHPKRQTAPRPHNIRPDSSGRYALVSDLGTDKLVIYRVDVTDGTLVPQAATLAKPGSGPRHATFNAAGDRAYVINELDNTLSVWRFAPPQARLHAVQTITTLPSDYTQPNTAADIHLHPSGKFLYGSNRGHDSIVVYAVNQRTGQLTLQGFEPVRGTAPRSFGIDPTGQWMLVANQASNNITVFQIDTRTGGLRFTGQQVAVSQPVCVAFA